MLFNSVICIWFNFILLILTFSFTQCDKITKRIDEIMAKEKTGADADQICEEMQLCGAPRETGPKKIARFFHKIEKFAEEA